METSQESIQEENPQYFSVSEEDTQEIVRDKEYYQEMTRLDPTIFVHDNYKDVEVGVASVESHDIYVFYLGDSLEGAIVENTVTREKRVAPFEVKINRVYPTKIREEIFINWSKI